MEKNTRKLTCILIMLFVIFTLILISKINKNDYLHAMRVSVSDDTAIRRLLKGALTDEINSRELFMKGIDYSYYYEQEDEV